MPRKPRPVRASRPEVTSEELWRWFVEETEDEPFEVMFRSDDEMRAIALAVMPDVLAYYSRLHPGRRPRLWWRFCAPQADLFAWLFPAAAERPQFAQPRKRVGGRGVPAWERFAYVPAFDYGVPAHWADSDPDDPPRFESQASYLRRHELLSPAESRRLTPADFEPEIVEL